MKTYSLPRQLLAELDAVLALKPDRRHSPLEAVANLLYEGRHYFWIGIYLRVEERLERQAFRGPEAPCHSFALNQGNVGTTGLRGVTKVVPDVSTDSTYSACFRETRSELVVPIKLSTRVLGVIDIESDQLNAFGREDRVLIETVAKRLARFLAWRGHYLLWRARRVKETPSVQSANA